MKIITQNQLPADEEITEHHHELHLPLPLDVAVKIFAHLPVSSIAQFRLVCRSWSSLLSSSSFLSHLQLECRALRPASREWWLVMASSTDAAPQMEASFSCNFCVFSFPLWKPLRLPIHTSPGLSDLLLRVASSQSLVPSVVNMLIASAGGLICAVVKGGEPQAGYGGLAPSLTYDMVVFNCLTGGLRTLPRPERLANQLISSCLISMRADEEASTYVIIVCDLKYREMEIYESEAGRWQVGTGIRAGGHEQDAKLADLLQSDMIRYSKEEIAGYKASAGRWRKAAVALPQLEGAAELMRSTVVKCGDGLYLVACLMKQAVRMQGYGVWKLEEEEEGPRPGLRWAEMGRTPAALVARLGRTTFERPAFYACRFVGEGEWVCMTGAHYTIGNRTRAEYWQPLLLNLRLRQWHLLPADRQCLCTFAFHPHFDARP